PSHKFLYTDGTAGVFAFTIDPVTGALAPVAGSPFPADNSPQPITVDGEGKFVYVANNGSNDVSAFSINATSGALTPVSGSPFATGASSSSFPLSISIDPSGTFVYVANSNSSPETISGFGVDSTTGALTPLAGSPFTAGLTQPFSLSVDPSGAYLYETSFDNSAGGIIQAFTIAPGTGVLTSLGSTFARDARDSATQLAISSGTAPATFAPQFVLVANSGSNDVSAYSINPGSGALAPVSGSPFLAGSSPMSVSTDLQGRFAYVANNGSNDISAFAINPTTGVLSRVAGSPFAAGTGPQSVVVDGSSEFVYAGNFGSQNISELALNPATGGLSAISGSPLGASFSFMDVSSDSTGQVLFAAGTLVGSNAGMLNIYTVNLNQSPSPAPNGSLQI